METIMGIVLAVLAAAAAYLFKDSQYEAERKRRIDLELETRKLKTKERLKESLIAQEGAKLGYEKAKQEFLNRYGSSGIDSTSDSSDK